MSGCGKIFTAKANFQVTLSGETAWLISCDSSRRTRYRRRLRLAETHHALL